MIREVETVVGGYENNLGEPLSKVQEMSDANGSTGPHKKRGTREEELCVGDILK